MKRALLIAGGTLGGLGAVMAITPPQFSTSSTSGIGAGIGAVGGSTSTPAASASATPAASKSATPAATKSATSKPVTTKKPTATKSATAQPAASASATATQTTAPAPATKGVSGTFAGPVVNVTYGNVQVQITVSNGKITDAIALQTPTGRNQRWADMAVPILKKQTLAAQSDAIQGASGASYTSYGWYKSLQGALAKAGL